jgi:hypothetical protein
MFTATGCQPNCSWQLYQYINIHFKIVSQFVFYSRLQSICDASPFCASFFSFESECEFCLADSFRDLTPSVEMLNKEQFTGLKIWNINWMVRVFAFISIQNSSTLNLVQISSPRDATLSSLYFISYRITSNPVWNKIKTAKCCISWEIDLY